MGFYGNVVHAFETAPHLKDYVNSLSGEKIVMAHSLGNRVVSLAVSDHGMGVGKYFMLNAAIPAEAYDPGLWNDSPGQRKGFVCKFVKAGHAGIPSMLR